MRCECGAEIPAGAMFCGKCGRRVPEKPRNVCPKCGFVLMPEDKFCTECGMPVSGTVSKPIPSTCRACGAVLNPGARFCGKCGTAVAEGSSSDVSDSIRKTSVSAAETASRLAAVTTETIGKIAKTVKDSETMRKTAAAAADTASRVAETVKKKAIEIHESRSSAISKTRKKPTDNILVKIALGICLISLIVVFLPIVQLSDSGFSHFANAVTGKSGYSLLDLGKIVGGSDRTAYTVITVIQIACYVAAALLFYFDHPRLVLLPAIIAFFIAALVASMLSNSYYYSLTFWSYFALLSGIALIVFASIVKKTNPKYIKVKVE